MRDLHTHILPRMDDGARDVQTSIRMLKLEHEHGVDTVALTPHFYRDREKIDSFLTRRDAAYRELTDAIARLDPAERAAMPRLILGAEVAWQSDIAEWTEIERLCYEGSRYILIELPLWRWDKGTIRRLYDFINSTGLTPVIAHIDRYFKEQRIEQLEELYALEVPIQISAEAFLSFRTRGKALACLRGGDAQLLISDCHGMEKRPPNLAAALQVIRRRCGNRTAEKLAEYSDKLPFPENK